MPDDRSNVFSRPDWFAISEERQTQLAVLLKNGGGDGTSGGMEARIIKLEADMEHVTRDVSELRMDMREVRVDIATLKENVRHLPTKPWIATALAGTIAAIGVIVAVIVRFLPHAA